MLRRLRARLARRLDPDSYAERERYARVVSALNEAASSLGYAYPTVRLIAGWALAQGFAPTGDLAELLASAKREVGDEPEELQQRLQSDLDGKDQTRH